MFLLVDPIKALENKNFKTEMDNIVSKVLFPKVGQLADIKSSE